MNVVASQSQESPDVVRQQIFFGILYGHMSTVSMPLGDDLG